MLNALPAGKEPTLNDFLVAAFDDPLGFVQKAYNWGQGELIGHDGPDKWQAEELENIGRQVREQKGPIRISVSSGHGIGKTTFSCWLIHWFIATRPHPQIVVTANTATQLETKTWRELALWNKRSIVKDLFEWTSEKFYLKAHPDTWFAKPITWNKDRAEAFAGTHAKFVLMVFDEASLIDDGIWEVAEGAMTTPGAIWVVFGNPTRNTGRFAECWNRFKHRWTQRKIDSRTAKMADKELIRQWIEDYGEDSDFVRVRVRGEFPRAASRQFISSETVRTAQARKITETMVLHSPVVVGVDVARYGDDQSVIYVRKGFATLDVKKFRGLDLISLGNIVCGVEAAHKADAVFVDVVGIGAGVVDYLRSIGRKPIEVNAGSKASDPVSFFNLRVEMWWKMRRWLEKGGAVPYDQELFDDLTAPEYEYSSKEQWMLEKKDDMRARGQRSPDTADALALTFAFEVSKGNSWGHFVPKRTAIMDYDVLAPMGAEMAA